MIPGFMPPSGITSEPNKWLVNYPADDIDRGDPDALFPSVVT